MVDGFLVVLLVLVMQDSHVEVCLKVLRIYGKGLLVQFHNLVEDSLLVWILLLEG